MDTRPFYFKQFMMYHHRSTMKIGTDAVLLGRWADVENVSSAVDIGTGSGIIPLMLAQRGVQHVDAVEIDAQSAHEAKENFELSPWRERLDVACGDVRQLSETSPMKYDLVISNPPFFTDFFKGEQERRNLARHTDSLSFGDLCKSARNYMNADSRFALVLPMLESIKFKEIAGQNGLFVKRQLYIVPVEGKEPNRINMELVLKPTNCVSETFTIRKSDSTFTDEYREFLKDYYITL